jgi:hypothetical protein
MSFGTANGEPIQTMTLAFRPRAAWRAELMITADTPPAVGDQVVIEAPGARLIGTARNSGADPGGQVALLVVGGKDRLRDHLGPTSYGPITVRDAVAGILDPLGETISPKADQAILAAGLSSWTRPAGAAGAALTALLEDAAPGATWHVADDGTVWLGRDAGEEVSPEHTVTRDAPEQDLLEVGLEVLELRVGHSFRGGPVASVVYRLDGALRATVTRTVGGDRVARGLGAATRRELAAAGVHLHPMTPCKVVSQNEDGTLELIADSRKVAAPPKVPLRHGLPFTDVRIAPGAEVLLGFENGDRKRPFAALPLKGGRLLHLVVDGDRFEWGGSDAVAIASKVEARLAAIEAALAKPGPVVGPIVLPPTPIDSEALFTR